MERYNDQAVPAEEKLSNILLQEYSITRSAKDVAAKRFLASAEYAGILQNGVLVLNNTAANEENISAEVDKTANVRNEEKIEEETIAAESKYIQPKVLEGYHFAIPTLSGATAQVTIPKEITAKDLDYILLYIQSMLPAFIENLKSEL